MIYFTIISNDFADGCFETDFSGSIYPPKCGCKITDSFNGCICIRLMKLFTKVNCYRKVRFSTPVIFQLDMDT